MIADTVYIFEQETSYQYLMTKHSGKNIPSFPEVWKDGEHAGKFFIQMGKPEKVTINSNYENFYFNNQEILCLSFINNILIGTYLNYILLIEMTTFTQIQFTFINKKKFKYFFDFVKGFDEVLIINDIIF